MVNFQPNSNTETNDSESIKTVTDCPLGPKKESDICKEIQEVKDDAETSQSEQTTPNTRPGATPKPPSNNGSQTSTELHENESENQSLQEDGSELPHGQNTSTESENISRKLYSDELQTSSIPMHQVSSQSSTASSNKNSLLNSSVEESPLISLHEKKGGSPPKPSSEDSSETSSQPNLKDRPEMSLRPTCEDGSSMSGSDSSEDSNNALGTYEGSSESEDENILAMLPGQSDISQTPQVLVDNSSDVRIGPQYLYNGPVTVKQFITVNGNAGIETESFPLEASKEGIPQAKNVANMGLKAQGIHIPGGDETGKTASLTPLIPNSKFVCKKRYIFFSGVAVLFISITIILILSLQGSDSKRNRNSGNIKIFSDKKDFIATEHSDVQWVVNINTTKPIHKLKVMWYGPGCKKIPQKSYKYNVYPYIDNYLKDSMQTELTIRGVTAEDRGLYKLKIYNDDEEQWGYFTLTVQGTGRPQNEYIVACYVAEWARLRQGLGKFEVNNTDPSQCTHIIYAFANLNTTTNTIYSADPGYDVEQGAYIAMTSLKKKHPHLKVLIGLGGWAERINKNYSEVAASPTSRKELARSISAFLIEYNFDGLDMHWQYPAEQHGRPADKQNFVELLKDLREEFDRQGKGWLLTAPIGVQPDTIERAYYIPGVSKYLDYMFAMCYAYHGFWDQQTGPNAPLFRSGAGDKLNVESSIQTLLELGAPPNKLVMGLPLYGRNFILKDEVENPGFKLPTVGEGFQGLYVQEPGTWGYNEICKLLQDSNWVQHWDSISHTPYLTQGNKFMSYDNEKSLKEKVELAIKNKLAGVMAYSLDTDDFRGDCAYEKVGVKNYPLMRAINQALYDAPFTSREPCEN